MLQDGGECVKTSDSYEHEPTLTHPWLSDDSLVQKKCFIAYMIVHNAFYKSINGSLAEILLAGKVKSKPRIRIYSSKDTASPFSQ